MLPNKLLITLSLLLVGEHLQAQISDDVAKAIRAVLLEVKVANKIFYKYDE